MASLGPSENRHYSTMRWTVHLEGGPRRVNHAGVAIGHKIFTFGGYCTGEDYETTKPMDVHLLNTVSLRWNLLPVPKPSDAQFKDTPYQRYGHTACAWEDRVHIWGGRNDKDGACNILYCFDSITHKWSSPRVSGHIPSARDGHSACISQNKMYIFGGYEEDLDRFSNDVFYLDLVNMTWHMVVTRGTLPHWRDFHSASVIGQKMYIFGGRGDRLGPFHSNNEVYCNRIMFLDLTTNTWQEPSTIGIPPIGRRSHSAFVYKDQLYIFGGYNGLHDIHFGDLFRFDPGRHQWSIVKVKGQGPCSRRRQCCCLIEDKLYLFGGTSPCNEPLEGVEFNLLDHADLYVLDFAPTLKTLCMMSVLENGLDQAALPLVIRWEIHAMTTNNNISRPLNYAG